MKFRFLFVFIPSLTLIFLLLLLYFRRNIRKMFSHDGDAKLNACIFDGLQIRSLMKDFDEKKGRVIWKRTHDKYLKTPENQINIFEHFRNFLGIFFEVKHQSSEYECVVEQMLRSFRFLGVRMSIKTHFLKSHFYYFPENCGNYRDEQGERFHQDIRTI